MHYFKKKLTTHIRLFRFSIHSVILNFNLSTNISSKKLEIVTTIFCGLSLIKQIGESGNLMKKQKGNKG